ncbi:iron-containing redox enzyme family protein [Streptomyces sp. NPDC050504]|uniref:iron-containing redox enzyme family protein n=1 Tax=Streptomyces sp. NPDC050504 TaxID=3365618 RepID=UPI0037AAFED8
MTSPTFAVSPITYTDHLDLTDQRELHDLYGQVTDLAGYAKMIEIEERWINPLAASYVESAPHFDNPGHLLRTMKDFIAEEEVASEDDPDGKFLAEEATLDQFKTVVEQFALDGLTESEALLHAVPRLSYRSGMAAFRVLIDELGCGNDDKAHSQLYRDLLTELGMSIDVADYRDLTTAANYGYVNMFHWVANRAPEPEYFLGSYTYFETSVLFGFKPFEAAAKRLGISNGSYYSEHLYIDTYHSNHMRTAVRTLENPDLAKVWAGVRLTSDIVAAANSAAIALAREVNHEP